METIIIIGASDQSKVVIDIVEKEGRYRVAGLVDQNRSQGTKVLGYKVLGRDEDISIFLKEHNIAGAIIAIGDNFIRSQVRNKIEMMCPKLTYVKAIHPKASIAHDVAIAEGSVVMAGAVINPSCTVGPHCIVNTCASLDHDSMMEEFSSMAPGSHTGGRCRVGNHSAIGIGAHLIHGVKIGEHTIIGAGATVLGDVSDHKVAYGTPARVIRSRKQGDPYL